jgi:hypothetical protein
LCSARAEPAHAISTATIVPEIILLLFPNLLSPDMLASLSGEARYSVELPAN